MFIFRADNEKDFAEERVRVTRDMIVAWVDSRHKDVMKHYNVDEDFFGKPYNADDDFAGMRPTGGLSSNPYAKFGAAAQASGGGRATTAAKAGKPSFVRQAGPMRQAQDDTVYSRIQGPLRGKY